MSTETLTVAPSSFEIEQILNDEQFRDAAGGVWVTGRTGNRWRLALMFANRTGNTRRALWAHIGQLRGTRNRLRVPVSLIAYTAGGAGGGTPLLVGAHTAGAVTLSIDGAPTSQVDWLKGGDFITIGNELKMVTGDVDTSGGAATIPIWPELHQNRADNAPVDIATPHGDFFLVESQGIGGVPHPSDWLNPQVTLVLEEDVYA